MSINIQGSTPLKFGLNVKQLSAVKDNFGISQSDIKDVQDAFVAKRIEAPEGLEKLVDSFEKYDQNTDNVLSVDELRRYVKREKPSLGEGAFSLIGEGEGTSLKQLEVFQDITQEIELETENLDRLVDKFNRYDKDDDGNLSSEEYEAFADRFELDLVKNADDQDVEDVLVKRVISAYEQNKESSIGFISSLFVAEA